MSTLIFLAAYLGLGCIVFYLRGVALRRIEAAGKIPNDRPGKSNVLIFLLWPLLLPTMVSTFGRYPKVK